jgi:hypothetical protein
VEKYFLSISQGLQFYHNPDVLAFTAPYSRQFYQCHFPRGETIIIAIGLVRTSTHCRYITTDIIA